MASQKLILMALSVLSLMGCAATASGRSQEILPVGTSSLAGFVVDKDILEGRFKADSPRQKDIQISVRYLGSEWQKGWNNLPPLATTVTDSRGEYLLLGLPASGLGTYYGVCAEGAGYGQRCFIIRLFQNSRSELNFALDQNPVFWNCDPPNIDPTKPGSGAVVVADPKTGVPMARPY